MDTTVEELVVRFQNGDDNAARELYERFAGRMLDLVRGMLIDAPHRPAIDSSAIVQEGFRSFFSAIGKPNFDSQKGSIGGLLTTIVRRKALAQLRRKYPTSYAPEEIGMMRDTMDALLHANLSEQEAEMTLREKLSVILDDLTKRERKVIALYLDRQDERSIPEIASVCRLGDPTVKRMIDRFTVRLQELLQSDQEEQSGEQ